MRFRAAPAIALFFLAPLVAEFLLGNLPVTFLGALVVLAPMYGGGALLIREFARRLGLGWPSIVTLGLAYGVIEEGVVTQSLFNPNYLGLRLLDYGYVPSLGISVWWTVFVLSLHMIWSTSVPIALVESLTPDRRRTPWLGGVGLGVTAALFIAGCVVLTRFQLKSGFVASRPQFLWTAAVTLGLIALALALGRKKSVAGTASSLPPSPLAIALAALATGSLFIVLAAIHPAGSATWVAAGIVVLFLAAGAANIAWSHRPGWSDRHRLAVAAGFLLTYAWHGFVEVPAVGHVSLSVVRIGNTAFAAGALALLAVAMSRVRDA